MIIFLSIILAAIVCIIMVKSEAGANVISGIIGGTMLFVFLIFLVTAC